MKIILDSYERTIREENDIRDTDQHQFEADLFNIIAFATASYSRRYFKTPKAAKTCVDMIHRTATKMLTAIEEGNN